MGSYCDSGGSYFTCFAEMDFPENNSHCFQASTWHIAREGSDYAVTVHIGSICTVGHFCADWTVGEGLQGKGSYCGSDGSCFNRSHEDTLHQESCARKAAWCLSKNIHELMNLEKTTFYIPGEAKVMSTPIASKRPEEREFVVDSGASMHMMSKKRIKLRRDGHSKKVQKPCSSVDC